MCTVTTGREVYNTQCNLLTSVVAQTFLPSWFMKIVTLTKQNRRFNSVSLWRFNFFRFWTKIAISMSLEKIVTALVSNLGFVTVLTSLKVCMMFGCLLGWYTIYTFSGGGLLPCNAIWQGACKVDFVSKSCILLYWQRYCLLHGTRVVSVSQTLRRWAESATYIRQGGRHLGHIIVVKVFLRHWPVLCMNFKKVKWLLWLPNRAGHYVLQLWFLSSFFVFFPGLLSEVADWMPAILPYIMWP